jgi:hypothetical protein
MDLPIAIATDLFARRTKLSGITVYNFVNDLNQFLAGNKVNILIYCTVYV